MLQKKGFKIALFIISIVFVAVAISTLLMPLFKIDTDIKDKPFIVLGYQSLFGATLSFNPSSYVHYELSISINYYLIVIYQLFVLSALAAVFARNNKSNSIICLVLLTLSIVGTCLLKLFFLKANEGIVDNGTHFHVGFYVALIALILASLSQVGLFIINLKK